MVSYRRVSLVALLHPGRDCALLVLGMGGAGSEVFVINALAQTKHT